MKGSCHCGAVTVEVPEPPEFMNQCNCSVCWKLGTMWGYYRPAEVSIAGAATDYRRADVADPKLAFPFCPTCGATIAWRSLHPGEERTGINMRLFEPAELRGVPLLYGDGRYHHGERPRRTWHADEIFNGAGA